MGLETGFAEAKAEAEKAEMENRALEGRLEQLQVKLVEAEGAQVELGDQVQTLQVSLYPAEGSCIDGAVPGAEYPTVRVVSLGGWITDHCRPSPLDCGCG